MKKTSKIFIAGHRGMVGSAVLRKLKAEGYNSFILKTSDALDLTNQLSVNLFFEEEKPEYVFLCAAKVGGIHANNTYRADFIYHNLAIQTNVIHAAYKYGVEKLLFLGSSCIYPKHAPQPIKEEYLLTGVLEPTNEPYAIAKIAGMKMCESYNRQYGTNFISAMPTNLYGQGDHYDVNNSHVLPSLIMEFHNARIDNKPCAVIWGSGKPLREFLYVDDLADALYLLMQEYTGNEHVNIGSGEEVSIYDLATLIKSIVGFKGFIQCAHERPDGMMRKLLDSSKMKAMGWEPKTKLGDGIKKTYGFYLEGTI